MSLIKKCFYVVSLFMGLLFALNIAAQDYTTNARNDKGWFKDDQDIARLVQGTREETRVCRWKSPEGYCYALTHQSPGGDMPVFLRTRAAFDSWLQMADRQSDVDYCLIVPPSWSSWTGNAPTTCGVHTEVDPGSETVA